MNLDIYQTITGPGTYRVSSCDILEEYNTNLIWGLEVTDTMLLTVTEFNDPGGFVSGTFSGKVTDSSGTRSPTLGEFRVRRAH